MECLLASLVLWGIGGSVDSESALRSAGTLQSRVQAPPPVPWPDGGPESLRSPCCEQAMCKNQTSLVLCVRSFHNNEILGFFGLSQARTLVEGTNSNRRPCRFQGEIINHCATKTTT
ncbi:hypothetical protein PoB_003452000 [Plakobranchus ocellatus]|uniref:Secreted protein n=1 Tax=Plakobranchus ocellatus TaxID=259542 RepID=A0AAV4AKX2_9GAST|nr:hypothetical protein PoB_003452000 [Plakobranchus ocellatus]